MSDVKEALDDIFNGQPESLDPFAAKERGEKPMNQWKVAGVLVAGIALTLGVTKGISALEYTQKDFASFTEIEGESDILAQVGRYCYPVIKKDRDTQTCALWLDKWQNLRQYGPEQPKQIADASEVEAIVNPTKGGGPVKGK